MASLPLSPSDTSVSLPPKPSVSVIYDITSTETSAGTPILMLTAEDLAKIQKKRKRSGASATKPVAVVEPTERHFAVVGQSSAIATAKANGRNCSSDDPLRNTPSSQLNQPVQYDPINFVHFYPYEDFSNFGKIIVFFRSSLFCSPDFLFFYIFLCVTDMKQYFLDSCRFMGIDLFDPKLKYDIL